MNSNLMDLGFQQGLLPVKYLGIPIIMTKLKKSDCYAWVCGHKMGLWLSKRLSFVGHLQLMKSVLMGLNQFWCTHLAIPNGVVKVIEKNLRSFLSQGNASDCSKPRVA